MGFLTDLGNVAVGAIERDREITKEDLAIRAENLQANRNLLIKQKEKKYDKELAEYYKEQTKFKEIENMNALKASGGTTDRAYAAFALANTDSNWNNLDDKTKKSMIDSYDGKTINYKLVGSEDEINKKAAAAMTLINNETASAIKDAKGNSFLINQILGKKEAAEKDLLSAIENKLNAAETVKMTEKEVNQDNVGLEVKVNGGGDFSSILKYNDGKWMTQYNAAVIKSEWNGATQDKTLQGLINTGSFKEFDTSAFVKKEDGQVVGWTQSGDGFVNGYEQTYKALHDSLDNKNGIITSFNANKLIGGANVNTSKLNDETNSILAQRASKQKIDGNDVFSMLPIGVVGVNNELYLDGNGTQLNGEQMSKALTIYNNFVKDQAILLVKSRDTGAFDFQTDENFIDAYNEIQANMNRNRINGKETNLAYAFKKKLLKDLEITLVTPQQEGSNIEGTPLVEDSSPFKTIPSSIEEVKADGKTQETKEDKTTTIKKEKKPQVIGSVLNYTSNGKDKSIDFSKLDENDVEQLKVKAPEIYKRYKTWLNNTQNKSIVANDTFSKNTNKFKNLLEQSENEILSGNTNQAKK